MWMSQNSSVHYSKKKARLNNLIINDKVHQYYIQWFSLLIPLLAPTITQREMPIFVNLSNSVESLWCAYWYDDGRNLCDARVLVKDVETEDPITSDQWLWSITMKALHGLYTDDRKVNGTPGGPTSSGMPKKFGHAKLESQDVENAAKSLNCEREEADFGALMYWNKTAEKPYCNFSKLKHIFS